MNRTRRWPRRAFGVATVLAVATALSSATAPRAGAHRGAPFWSHQKVMARVDGAAVVIGRWKGRVDAPSTLCSGDGRGASWSGARHWRHFTCTWTIFKSGGQIDRDVTFRLHTVTTNRFVITSARFGTE